MVDTKERFDFCVPLEIKRIPESDASQRSTGR